MSLWRFFVGAAPCLRASLISESPAAPNGRAQIVIDEGAVMDVAGAIPAGPGTSMRSPMSTRTKVLAGVNTSNPPPTSTVNRRSPPASAHGSAGGKMRAHAIGWCAGSNRRTPARARANGLHQVMLGPAVTPKSASIRPAVIATRAGMSAPKKFSSPSTPRNRVGNQESRPPKPTSSVSSSPIRANVIYRQPRGSVRTLTRERTARKPPG